jgi:hypothetical protein
VSPEADAQKHIRSPAPRIRSVDSGGQTTIPGVEVKRHGQHDPEMVGERVADSPYRTMADPATKSALKESPIGDEREADLVGANTAWIQGAHKHVELPHSRKMRRSKGAVRSCRAGAATAFVTCAMTSLPLQSAGSGKMNSSRSLIRGSGGLVFTDRIHTISQSYPALPTRRVLMKVAKSRKGDVAEMQKKCRQWPPQPRSAPDGPRLQMRSAFEALPLPF